jgi:hypothetical protein
MIGDAFSEKYLFFRFIKSHIFVRDRFLKTVGQSASCRKREGKMNTHWKFCNTVGIEINPLTVDKMLKWPAVVLKIE